MATYEFRCPGCGPFELRLRMGTAAGSARCPDCAGSARRVFTAASFARTPRPLGRAFAAQEASAYEPKVVGQVPAARRRPAPPADPRHAGLPRP